MHLETATAGRQGRNAGMAERAEPARGPLSGARLAAALLAVAAWGALVYAETYPRIYLAWREVVLPSLPAGVRWNPHWLALPLCAALFAAAHGLGRRILRSAGPRTLDEAEAQALSLPVGLLPLVTGAFALACLGLLRPAWILALWAAALALGARELIAVARRVRLRRPSLLASVAITLLAVQWGAAAIVSTSPDLFFDAPHFHLYPITTYLRAGGFATVPGFVPLHLPELAHLLFALLYAAAGNAGTRAVSLLAGIHVVAFVGWAAARFAGRRAGWIAALTLGSTPVFVSFATVTQPDLVLTVLAVPGLWVAIRYGATARGALLAGALAGGVAATKIVGGLIGASIVLLCAVAARREGARAMARAGAYATAAAAVIAAPWFLKTWIAVGNPAFPAGAAVFGHHVLDAEELRMLTASYFSRFGMGRDVRSVLLLPWNLTVHGGTFSGCMGALFLSALPLVALARRERLVPALSGAAALSFLAMAASQHVQRYFFPGLALLTVAIAIAIERLGDRGAVGRVARAALVGVVVATAVLHLPFFQRGWMRDWFPYELEELPLANAAGLESDAAFLARHAHLSCYPLAERHSGRWGAAKILSAPAFTETPATWFEGHLYNGVVADRTLVRARAAGGAEAVAAVLAQDGFTHVLADGTIPPADAFSPEGAFAARHLRRVDRAGNCILYEIVPESGDPRTIVDVAGRVSAAGGVAGGTALSSIVRGGVDARLALTVIAPHSVAVPIQVPPEGAVFESALAMRWPDGDGAVAVLSWEEAGRRTELLRVPLLPAPRQPEDGHGWVPVRVDLSRFAGRSGALVLASDPGPAGDDVADWIGWAWPAVVAAQSSR